MVTAGTTEKRHYFVGDDRLDYLQASLLECAREFGWTLYAWVVFPNHYHFLGQSPEDPRTLSKLVRKLHATTAVKINRLDAAPGRRVWYQYWDSRISFEKSYLARLNYIHQNAVRHGMVRFAGDYKWSSAKIFFGTAPRALQRTLDGFADLPRLVDDF